jgi:sec-independent protein translocase protein TatC
LILGSSPSAPKFKYIHLFVIMYPSTIYFREVIWRLFYCLLSSIIVFFTTFYNIEFLFLFEVYPFIKSTHKKFIATHITELFNSVLQTCFFVTYISEFPLLVYHVLAFFSTCWFAYQLTLLRFYTFLVLLLFFQTLFFTNIYLLPKVFVFFTQWEALQNVTLFQVELEVRIHTYLLWVNHIYSFINFSFSFFLTTLFLFVLFISPYQFYSYLNSYKKQVTFTAILIFMVILPPDFWIQLVLIVLSFFFIEVIFFLSCFRKNQST